jgi:hypothetical protein
MAVIERVLALYREKYFDLNMRHFHEKLEAEHQIQLSYSWVKGVLQGAGLIARGRKRGVHRQRRERRPLPGMLLHIDGSEHRWFHDDRWYDLLVILDDATSEIYYAQAKTTHAGRDQESSLYRYADHGWIWSSSHVSACGRGYPVASERRTHHGRGARGSWGSIRILRAVRATSVDCNRGDFTQTYKGRVVSVNAIFTS